MEYRKKVFGFTFIALLVVISFLAVHADAAATTARQNVDSPYFRAGTKIEAVKLEITPGSGAAANPIIAETTIPEGLTVSNLKTTNGSAAVAGNKITWTLSSPTAKVEMTYDLTVPAANPPLFALLDSAVKEGTLQITLSTTLKHEPGLSSKWVIGADDAVWAIMDGVLRAHAVGGSDPKHAWVDLELADGDYTVVCDCRMINWVDGDLPRAGIAIRINPDDNGANLGSDRGINLLFHDDTNSIDILNDLVSWGTRTDIPWEIGQWYSMAIQGFDTAVDAFFIEKGAADPLSDAAYLTTWDDSRNANRSPGFPGLTASTYAGLEVQFDNFKVIDSSGKVVFEDNFDKAEVSPLTAKRTVENIFYKAGTTISGIKVEIIPSGGRTTNAVITETIPDGFTVANINAGNGSASVSGNKLIWTLANAASKVEMTYDLTVPATNAPLYGSISGVVQDGSWKINLDAVTLKHVSGLGPQWIVGSGGGIWVVMDGVLRAYADTAVDPKHAWVDIAMADGNYTVVCDCRMVNWVDGDLPRAGVSIRINPDDNGANVGSDRGINLLFHDDTNSIDILNDRVSWGTRTDIPWEIGQWYTFALQGFDTAVDAFFIEKGAADPLSDAAYLATWDDSRNADRSPGFPGLAASTYAGLEVQFDNFKVIDSTGKVVFEDDFNEAVAVPDWSLY